MLIISKWKYIVHGFYWFKIISVVLSIVPKIFITLLYEVVNGNSATTELYGLYLMLRKSTNGHSDMLLTVSKVQTIITAYTAFSNWYY